MSSGWSDKRLGDLFEITSSKRVHKEDWRTSGVPFWRAREIVQLYETGEVRQELYITEEMYAGFKEKYGVPQPEDLLVTGVGTLGVCYQVKPKDRFYFKDGNIIWLKKRGDFDSRFVEYAFQSDVVMSQVMDGSMGATVGTYTIERANETMVPMPSREEQQRIVGKLDAAFAALAEAQAHVERNRDNARELFESYLNGVFEGKGDGWVEKTIGECFRIRSGDFLPAKSMKESGPYEVYGGNGVAGKHDAYNLSGSNVVIGRVGAKCGNVRHIETPIWLTDNAFSISEFHEDFDHEFLTYLLNHLDLRSFARQAAQPVVSFSSLKDVVLRYPSSIAVQRKIAERMGELEAETEKLDTTYQQKLTELAGLKKAVLGAAFRGEL